MCSEKHRSLILNLKVMRSVLILLLTYCFDAKPAVFVSGAIAINATLTSNGGLNGEIVCTPSNRLLAQDFVVQMWTKAREELGLSDELGRLTGTTTTTSTSSSNAAAGLVTEGLSDKEVKDKIETIRGNIESFYYNPASAAVYFPPNNKQPVVYARIWKCANELITRNLGQFDNYVRKAVAPDFSALKKIFAEEEDGGTALPKVFAFVRDPLERFCSGFTEAVYRDMRQNITEEKQKAANMTATTQIQTQIADDMSLATVDSDRVKAIIRGIVDLSYPPPIKYLNHLFPMSATFFTFPIDILGHLEHLEQDWETLVVPAYYITKQFDPAMSASIHATSANHPHIKDKDKALYNAHDPNNARTVLRELLKNEPHYKRAICALLLIDYVCLPEYKLPSECMHLKDERHAMETVLRNS